MSERREPDVQAVFMTYRELAKFNEALGRVETKLNHALEINAKQDALEKRVTALETQRAVQQATGGVYRRLGSHVTEIGIAVIATGIWWEPLWRAIKSLIH